ncbi:SusC/RagA family TonB-linked outer membrane protein [Xylanibacter ruminicola]|nr:TonB-dependent receptor [Xylanibacter ruminicola]GJG32164.1 SusC/RagA family TonB-linked outer membrane protein [Xylanibacter ruminicola]SEH83882.1 TonB-linked outer membrane protein, SusC/RagA family [Xylanibacter ruminicola]SFB72738.1 TonB-linked outer membrane protein, SusC/RagA family [Xylanibacter ruminicola]SHM67616.1 TonB-linked outer membrane protein, SusC/RagA family [Xylanibacter ruminicola]
MKKSSIMLMLMALMMSVTSFAQGLKGHVIDENGEPVIGATVAEKSNPKNATITDFDGNFVVNIQAGHTLTVTYIGYQTFEGAAKNGMTINLKPDNKVLDEVVVVGYGVQKKSSVTGAISQVKPEDMENRTIANAQQALQGKTSGVQIIQSSAAPGSSPTIRVRGYSSNSSSEPLFVVDGVRLSDISGIDPSTIASMEILKDAASAAIYGAEAGNGVVLITTKKGKPGQGKITYDFMFTDESLARIPKMLNAEQYIQYMDEGNIFTKDYMLKNWDGVTNTAWTDVAFNHGHMQKHALSFTGGNDRGNYFLSLAYLNNNGIVKGDADVYKRLTATINAEYKIKDWLKVGTTNQIEKYDVRSVSTNSEYGSLLTSILMLDPLTPDTYTAENLPYQMVNAQANGKQLLQDENGNYYAVSKFYAGEQYHPMIMRDNGLSKNQGFNINGSIYGDFTPLKGLTVTSRFGYRLAGTRSSSTSLPFYGNGVQSRDYLDFSAGSSTSIYYQWENFANYMKQFGGHTVTAMVGMSFQKSSSDNVNGSLTANGEDALKKNDPLFYYLNYANASATKGVSGETNESTKYSYFGRLSYDFMGRYLLQASLRADAADLSKLSKKTRWGYFPAVSVGWTISEEKFFAPLKKAFDSLKFRASWGQNGSLSALGGYSYSTDMALGGLYPFSSGINYTQAAAPSTMGNDDLKWETSEQLNFGFDGILMGGRMTFGIDYFIKKTKDLLVWGTTPSLIIGGSTSPMNAGNVENKGFEFELGWRDHIGDFNYSIRANLSTLSNKVTYIDPSITRLSGSNFHTYTITYFEKGYPVYYFRGYKFAGIDKETGNPLFEDLDGDGKVSDGDLTYIGDAIPDFTYGLTLTAAYKGIDLTVFGTGSHGNKIFNCINRPDYAASNRLKEVFYDNRWTVDNPNGTVPRAGANDMDKYATSSALVYDGSFFKIKQIQLGYTLPKNLINKVALSHARIYASLDDFFTFSKYPGFDPEAATNSTSGMGIDKGGYPTSKKVVLGLNIEF